MTPKKRRELTEEERAAFVDEGGKTCPFCGSDELYPAVGPRMTDKNGAVTALLECDTCRSILGAEYALDVVTFSLGRTKC